MTKIKICGITNLDDAISAQNSGADFLGFVFAESPRKITPDKAKEIISGLSPDIGIVALFVNEKREIVEDIAGQIGRVDLLQFHGDETPEYCMQFPDKRTIKAFRIKDKESLSEIENFTDIDYALLDAYNKDIYGGSGETFNWKLAVKAKGCKHPVFLSGGLNPDNVRDAISMVKPFAVDVSSGVESVPGKKDPALIKRFIDAVKSA